MDVKGSDIQLEKGNFYLLHKALDGAIIRAKLSVYEKDVIRTILYLTYGHKPKRARAEMGQEDIAEVSGISGSNVWKALNSLIEKNIIKREGGGRGRGKRSTIGINKYIEEWKVDFREAQGGSENTSVESDFDGGENTSVERYLVEENTSVEMHFTEPKIPLYRDQNTSPEMHLYTGPNTLIQKHNTTTNGTDRLADDAFSLMKEAYQRLDKFGPNRQTPDGKEAMILALRLVESYGFENCVREITTVRERHDALIRTGEKGIKSPLSYLASILDRKAKESQIDISGPEPVTPSNVVTFSIKDIEQ